MTQTPVSIFKCIFAKSYTSENCKLSLFQNIFISSKNYLAQNKNLIYYFYIKILNTLEIDLLKIYIYIYNLVISSLEKIANID